MTKEDAAFIRAFHSFDFDAVHALMTAANWQWRDYGVPTVRQLMATVFELWMQARSEKTARSVGTGGFTVGISDEHDEPEVYISFEMVAKVAI